LATQEFHDGHFIPKQPFYTTLLYSITFSYLGEILVRMGAITRLQLREMLELQHMLGREAGQSST
jgi:hypothetical protein